MKKIVFNIQKVVKKGPWLRAMRSILFDLVGDQLYAIKDEQTFVYTVLQKIAPINVTLTNNPESIHQACQKMISYCKLKKVTLYKLTDTGPEEIKTTSPDETPVQVFMRLYLQLHAPPGKYYQDLEKDVKQDIQDITALIGKYQENAFIKEVLSQPIRPRNQEERMLLDFYKRCLQERDIILDHYLHGIRRRSLAKANYAPPGLQALMSSALSVFHDRPYYFVWSFSTSFFDCTKLDLISHRVYIDSPQDYQKMELLYKTDKRKFYRQLFKKIKPAHLMDKCQHYLRHLPLKNDRTAIFQELALLFKGKRWIGFYALGLSQIEGLFSEMVTAIFSNHHASHRSLPDKVNLVRPYHEMSKYNFDYYQYHVPTLRNKFMHTGFDEDIEVKSMDILSDLHSLLKIFFELNTPLVKLKKLMTQKKPIDFVSFVEFAGYFELIDQLNKVQKDEWRDRLFAFQDDFLTKETDIVWICLEIADKFPPLLEKASAVLEQLLMKHEMKLSTFSLENVTTIRKVPELVKNCSGHLENLHREYSELQRYDTFLNGYKKHLPSLPKSSATLLEEIPKTSKALLKKMILFKQAFHE